MCFTDDDALADVMISIRVHGQGTDKYDNVRVGINGRMDTMQAAVLLAKLPLFAEEIGLRQEVARRYSELLEGVAGLTLPAFFPGTTSAWAQYSVLAESSGHRARLKDRLKEKGIPTAVYYPTPLHLQTAFARLGYERGAFPVSEDLSGRIFSLPMHPYLAEEQQRQVADALKGA
jgi:dTDP-4-amino-4,6-dideoxygalactose transaminase